MSDDIYKDIITGAWAESIRRTVKKVIAEHAGHGLDTEIQQVIKEQALKMIESDAELQGMIRDALKSWISTQTAEDHRKAREENVRRFGRG